MKRFYLFFLLILSSVLGYSQNTSPWPVNGNVGIGTTNPLAPLDVSGNIILRNYQNVKGAGVSILFTPYGDDYLHAPRIRSYLDYAAGSVSCSRLILSSYWNGYRDELTLVDGKVGIGTNNPGSKLSVREPSNENVYLDVENNTVKTFMGAGGAEYGIVGTRSNHDIAFYTNGSEKMRVTSNGNVGIGTGGMQGYKLAVAGNVIAESVNVKLQSSWPDYVFKPDYKLAPLNEVKDFIQVNQHLPDMPSEQQIAREGINLGEINILLVKKMEEITLYLIKSQEQISTQQTEINKLKEQLNKLTR